MTKKILVTGGAGFIGSQVVRKLLELGHEVVIYDYLVHYVHPLQMRHLHNITRRLEGIQNKVRIVRGNTQDVDFLARTLREVEPQRIIHLAAMPLANLAIENPEEAANSILAGTMNLLQAARDMDRIERLVYVSSSMVYGDFVRIPADEDHPTNPKEVYGGLKLCGETLTRVYGRLYDLDYTIVRPSAVYGPTDNNARVLGIFIENALNGKTLQVRGAKSMLDFTFVTDAAAGIVAAALHPNASGQTFNVTRGQGRTILEAAKIVARLVPGTTVQILEAQKNLPARGMLDITRARTLIDYEPKVSLEEGLSKYVRFQKEQRGLLSVRADAWEDADASAFSMP